MNPSSSKGSMKQLKRDLDMCLFCKKKSTLTCEGMGFCGQDHLRAYKEKTKIAKAKMRFISKCSTCGKPVRSKRWTMIDCRVKKVTDEFTPYRFCSERCFENWDSGMVPEIGD